MNSRKGMGSIVSRYAGFIAGIVPLMASLAIYGVYRFQTSLIYPSNFPEGSREVVDVPTSYDIEFEDVTIRTSDGERLKAYEMIQPGAGKTVVMLCPNAGNMGHSLPIAEQFYKKMGYNVFVFSYRGYGKSTGSAHEQGIKLDCHAVVNYLAKHKTLSSTSIVLYGRSLGGAIGIYMATLPSSKGLISGLVLENTFLSIPKLIPNVLPLLSPLSFLCTEKWESERLIRHLPRDIPVLFLSGKKDELVPPSHVESLYDLCPSETKQLAEFDDGMHNDTIIQPAYWSQVFKFIKQIPPID